MTQKMKRKSSYPFPVRAFSRMRFDFAPFSVLFPSSFRRNAGVRDLSNSFFLFSASRDFRGEEFSVDHGSCRADDASFSFLFSRIS